MKAAPACLCLYLLKGLSACALLAALGCGGLRIVPVSGKATLDGQPLTRGVISFNPDPAKGNNVRAACTGRIKGDGQYEIFTDDGSHVKKGAPLGWYKVTILSVTPGDDKPLPVNKQYTDPDTTRLSIEVVADPKPGAYDLEFKK
jgi:hypothetical protein